MRTLARIFGTKSQKVKFLLEFAEQNSVNAQNAQNSQNSGTNRFIIDDPYYTRDFEQCYYDIARACDGLASHIENLAKI